MFAIFLWNEWKWKGDDIGYWNDCARQKRNRFDWKETIRNAIIRSIKFSDIYGTRRPVTVITRALVFGQYPDTDESSSQPYFLPSILMSSKWPLQIFGLKFSIQISHISANPNDRQLFHMSPFLVPHLNQAYPAHSLISLHLRLGYTSDVFPSEDCVSRVVAECSWMDRRQRFGDNRFLRNIGTYQPKNMPYFPEGSNCNLIYKSFCETFFQMYAAYFCNFVLMEIYLRASISHLWEWNNARIRNCVLCLVTSNVAKRKHLWSPLRKNYNKWGHGV
jgi:hypothetical protein